MNSSDENIVINDISNVTNESMRLNTYTQPILKQLNNIIKPSSILSAKNNNIILQFIPKIDFNLLNPIIDSILLNVKKSLQFFSNSLKPILSPFYDWINSFDFSHILPDYLEEIKHFSALNKKYMDSMYEAHWFPYVGWHSDISLLKEILYILNSSKGISQRAVKRIDKAVFNYYPDSEIRKIKKGWQNSNIDKIRKKILIQSINAYFRKEYAITSICLSTLWQSLIFEKSGDFASGRKDKETKQHYAQLVEKNGYDKIFKSFFDNFIMYDCRCKEDVKPDVPGRHGNAHGWYSEYPKKKAALNAIFLTDFILNLEETTSEVA